MYKKWCLFIVIYKYCFIVFNIFYSMMLIINIIINLCRNDNLLFGKIILDFGSYVCVWFVNVG